MESSLLRAAGLRAVGWVEAIGLSILVLLTVVEDVTYATGTAAREWENKKTKCIADFHSGATSLVSRPSDQSIHAHEKRAKTQNKSEGSRWLPVPPLRQEKPRCCAQDDSIGN